MKPFGVDFHMTSALVAFSETGAEDVKVSQLILCIGEVVPEQTAAAAIEPVAPPPSRHVTLSGYYRPIFHMMVFQFGNWTQFSVFHLILISCSLLNKSFIMAVCLVLLKLL